MATDTKNILRHHHHHHAPVIHDLGLLHFLIYLWFGIVLLGFVLDNGYQYFHDHSLFSLVPKFSSSFAPLTQVDDWTHLEAHGDVDLSYKTIIPTSGLHAHRAEVIADLPIEALLHVFRDTPNNIRWDKDLTEAEEYHKSGAHHQNGNTQVQTSIVRRRFKIPVPGFADRELLMHKKMTAIENDDGTHSTVTYEFNSLSEEDIVATGIAVCTGCIRATDLGSKWTFTSLDNGMTKITAEAAVDPNMNNLSSFFINLLQKNRPHVSMHQLMKETRHHLGRDDDVQVANTFFRLFPLKT